ncbi:MAG: AMP-binding protein [Solirubrobacteraceae bacterium]
MNAPSWLPSAATRHPERTAVETPEGALTYAELLERAEAAPARSEIDAVAGPDFAVALHACLLRGVPVIPLDPRLSVTEREERRRLAGDIPAARDVATVLFTSGTTARPRPVHLTYGNWEANARGSAQAIGLDPEERWLCALPLAHVGGLSILIRSAIYGTTAVLHERFDAAAVARALDKDGITVVSLVPTTLGRVLDVGLDRPPDLRCALLGGAPASPALLERAAAASIPIAQTYGLTEACSQVTTSPPGDPATAGPPLPGVEVRIAQDGEILVGGPTVAPCAVADDGFLHTGDLGALDERGRLIVTGRKADTIVSGGENVAPAEVEAVLLAHPAVLDAGVFGRPDVAWGEAVAATVVLRPGEAATEGALREYCSEHLARFKVPKEIRFAPALPRTPSGKLLRRALAD